jgi:hypothetical protein
MRESCDDVRGVLGVGIDHTMCMCLSSVEMSQFAFWLNEFENVVLGCSEKSGAHNLSNSGTEQATVR